MSYILIIFAAPKQNNNMKNSNLHEAKRAKNDEFYTQLTDIEKELQYYTEHFKGSVVLCNCNDAIHGSFSQYFALNFERLGLKELICTSYGDGDENGKVCIYHGDKNGNKIPDIEEWEQYELKGKGDFRSDEMIELLKRADIVCTNPPFSLFREYVAQLMEYEKKFLIIGNTNAITYKELFPFIKDNLLWLGVSSFNVGMYFYVPDDFEYAKTYKFNKELNDKKVNRVSSVCWFTNLEHNKRNTPLDLYRRYNEEEYPKYDNYDAIEVSKVSDIPMDYNDVMGVPITFLDKYCPTQFKIIKFRKGDDDKDLSVNGKCPYFRILIKRV